ncbi:hypothetical protein [Chitinophaga agri]|uniref:Uncharacterized protein n=1 Tax=Chitinophaga agri TaxID=2703787 RepID=A0A6B9ZBN6_9BACT|nr:hypothetical protein [Chitinophaga agri]QHS59812.1 hypothetical protein GWR21_09475 [Chitinophaga agri]
MINSWTIITKQQAKYYTSEFYMKGKRNAQEIPAARMRQTSWPPPSTP